MKIAFLSAMLNTYQKALSDSLYSILGKEYRYIDAVGMTEERRKLGWSDLEAPYLLRLRDSKEHAEAMQWIDEADAVIYGPGTVKDKYIRNRIRERKLTIACTERVLKKGDKRTFWLRFLKWRFLYRQRDNVYLLCMGAYVARDFYRFGLFYGRAYRYGYFQDVSIKDDKFYESKMPHTILWAGRMLQWKHPEWVLRAAEDLRKEGYDFCITMIGNGEMFSSIQSEVKKQKLGDVIRLMGGCSPEEVRKQMELSEIFLTTSDRNEGWGVVINEAMDAGCAVVANEEIGSVPYLISDGKNGSIYRNYTEMLQQVRNCLEDRALCQSYGKAANETINGLYSPRVAAPRTVEMVETLLEGNRFDHYSDGPCSRILF